MKIFIDTNICIYLINKKSELLIEKFRKFKTGEIGVSSITYSELIYGAYNSAKVQQNLNALSEFFLPLEIIPFDSQAAFTYGQIRATMKKSGIVIGPMDLLIGSHALSMEIPVVTNNEKEFRKIPGLQTINWLKDGV